MGNEQIVIDKLYEKYSLKGFITEAEIMDMCTEYDLPFHITDYVCDQIISRGVLISDGVLVNDTIEESYYDYSQIDYDVVYESFERKCPGMSDLVDFVRNVRPLQKGEVKKLFVQINSGNTYARDILISKNLRTAIRMTMNYEEKTSIPLEDLFEVAVEGLFRAVDRYDPWDDIEFSNYVLLWIRNYLDRFICDFEEPIKRPVNSTNESCFYQFFSLEEYFESENDIVDEEHGYDYMIEKTDNLILREEIIEVLGTLTQREEEILRLRYGIDSGVEMTLEQVGSYFHVTRERIRQLEAKALRKLRHPYRAKKIKDFL